MTFTQRLAGAITIAILVAAPSAAAAESAQTQQLARLDHPTVARRGPGNAFKPVAFVSRTRPITAEQTTLPVIAHATDRYGTAWLDVLLPGRPNGHTGWLRAAATTAAATPWRVTVRISTRRVMVFRYDRPARSFTAVVGKPSTPTPVGRFFVEEAVRLSARDVGEPFALALSARSDVLQEFAGGPGQIALHGTANIAGAIGTAASHGCIRLDTGSISWLAARLGPGTPVTITR